METLRLQIAAPSLIDLCGLAAQRRRPVRVRRIDGATAVTAQLAWEAQEHEFPQSVLGRGARVVNEIAPALLRYMLADQLRRLVLSLLLGAVMQFLAAMRFPVFEVQRQSSEICCRGRMIIGLSHRPDMRFGLMMWALETPLERRERVLQSPRHNSFLGFDVMATLFAGERAQQILAADDSDHFPVPHDGHTLDPIGGEHTRNLAGIGILANGDDRLRHDVACDPIGATQARKEIRAY